MGKKLIFLAAGFIIAASLSYASDKKVDLGKIVVTPYESEVEEADAGYTTSIFDGAESRQQGITSFRKVLEKDSSICSALSGNYGGTAAVFIRGANSHHTQYIRDDLLIYDPIVTSAYYYGWQYLPLGNIKEIEVAKGPFSSLYGSGSIGGTIRSFTKKGAGRPHIETEISGGSYNTRRESIYSGGQIKNFSYSLALTQADSKSFSAAKEKNGNSEKDPWHNFSSSLRLDYDFSPTLNASLITHYLHSRYEYDRLSSQVEDDDDNYAHYYEGSAEAKLSHQINRLKYNIVLGYTKIYRKGWEDNSTDYWYSGGTKQAKLEGEYAVNKIWKIVSGINYLKERGEGFWAPSYVPKHTAISRGLFMENIFRPLKNLLFSGTFRVEKHSKFGQHNTYSLSTSYFFEKTKTKIKASLGEGFKAPSLYQLYDVYSGNPSLNPEESQSWEAGFEQEAGKKVTYGSTYFHTYIKNMIDWVSTGIWSGKYKNVGKAHIEGVESFIRFFVSPHTSTRLSYTYMEAKNAVDNTRLLRRPNNKITLSIESQSKKLKVFFDMSYVGNRRDSGSFTLKPYLLANLAFNYTLSSKKEVFLRIENIFDEAYEEVRGYQTPHVSIYSGIKIRW